MSKIIIILLSLLYSTTSFQIPFKIRSQIYQYPLNLPQYRNLVEVEKPSPILGVPIVTIEIGTNPVKYNLIYSTGTFASSTMTDTCTSVQQQSYQVSQSTTSEKELESYESNSYTYGGLASVINDYVNFIGKPAERVKIRFFNYLHYTPNTLISDGELGMSKIYVSLYTDPYITKDVKKFSVMEQLYENQFIKNKIFAHKYLNENEGTLYIGEIPEGKYDIKKCQSTTEKGEPSYFWNCRFTNIKIGSKNMIIEQKTNIATFSTGERFIFLPQEAKNIIEEYQNYSEWSQNNCELSEHIAYQELHCKYNGFNHKYFPTITFDFDGYEITLPPEKVFYYNYNQKYYRLLMVLNNRKSYWILGSPALKGHNMIFDSSDNSVSFFKNESSNKLTIILVILGIIIIGGVGLWYIRRKKLLMIEEQKNHPFYKL